MLQYHPDKLPQNHSQAEKKISEKLCHYLKSNKEIFIKDPKEDKVFLCLRIIFRKKKVK